jgi:hypothetical protein
MAERFIKRLKAEGFKSDQSIALDKLLDVSEDEIWDTEQKRVVSQAEYHRLNFGNLD